MSTRHQTQQRAAKAAVGRAGHHNLVRIVDHSQNLEPLKVQELTIIETDIDEKFLEEQAA